MEVHPPLAPRTLPLPPVPPASERVGYLVGFLRVALEPHAEAEVGAVKVPVM